MPMQPAPILGEDVAHAMRQASRALCDDPRSAAAVLARSFERLAGDGVELPYAADRLPLLPAVLPATWAPRLELGCRAMFDGIEAIFREVFAGDVQRLADYLLFTPADRSLLDIDGGRADWAAVARPDFMAGPDGPALIESNITTSIGLLEAGLLGEILLEIPAVRGLVDSTGLTTVDPARALVDAVARSVGSDRHPLVVFADWTDELAVWRYLYRYLTRLLHDRGVTAEPIALEDLEVRGDGVYGHGRRVDVIYRFYTTTRLTKPHFAAVHEPLLAAVKSGRVRLWGAYRHKLFTPKLFLALLSDERFADRIPPATANVLREVVPWTRIVADRRTVYRGEPVDLLDFAAKYQDALVLKPNLGFGGKDVTIGSEVTPDEWAGRLSAVLADEAHWLLQEKVRTVDAQLPFLVNGAVEVRPAKVDYGAFMIERTFAGAARRNATSTTGRTLTNLSLGGGLSPVFFGR